VTVSEDDHVNIARRVTSGGEATKQAAGGLLELALHAAARVDHHQLAAGVHQDGVEL
jgi:hypothetical protein